MDRGRRPPRRRRREGGARARGRRGRGARPRRSRRSRRCTQRFDVADLVRHVAGVRARRGVHAPARSSATTSAASPTPTTSRSRRSTTRRSSPPTSACAPRSPTPSPTTTTWSPTSPRSSSTGPRRPRPPGLAPRPDRDRRRARPRQDAGDERGAAARERRARRATATRCCSRRRTSGSSASCSASTSTTAATRRWPSVAYGVAHGCRIVRVHDVAGSVAVCRIVEALARARGPRNAATSERRTCQGRRPDPARRRARRAVDELLGGDDRTLALEDFTRPRAAPERRRADGDDGRRRRRRRRGSRPRGGRRRGAERGQSPPFMTARASSCVRDAGSARGRRRRTARRVPRRPARHDRARVRRGRRHDPGALTKKLKEVGRRASGAPGARRPSTCSTDALRTAAESCSPTAAAALITSHLGDDAGRDRALVDVLGVRLRAGHRRSRPTTSRRTSATRARCPSTSSRTRSRRATSPARSRSSTGCSRSSSAQQPKPMHPLQILGDAAQLRTAAAPARRSRGPQRRPTRSPRSAGKVKEFPARKALDAGAARSAPTGSAGVRPARAGRPRPQGRARDPRGRGAGGAGGAAGRASTRRCRARGRGAGRPSESGGEPSARR